MLFEVRYIMGTDLFNASDYEGAIARLELISDYKDTKTLLTDAYYLYGVQLYNAKNYTGAEKWLALAGDYKDAATLLAEARRLKDANAGSGNQSGGITTGDGYRLSSGDTVYIGAGGLRANTVYKGRVTSIDSANSVNVRWESAMVMNFLGGVSYEARITYNMWGSGSYVAQNGATMPVTDKTNYRAEQLYRSANNAW
jgi:hypothetical protein